MGELQINAVVNSPTVSTLAVTVTAADLSDPFVFNFELVNGTATGTITVPAGGRRTITVRAYDVSGIETHEGQVLVNIRPGPNPAVRITLRPLNGQQPIEITLGSFTVTVAPTARTLDVGQTLQLTATVTDVDGTVVGGTADVVWASDAPAVATVAASGLVTAHLEGTARIVASFGGVAAAAQITVVSGVVAVLIVHTDPAGAPQAELLATGRFSRVDLFDATSGTPTLATLQPYAVVLAYTNFTPSDATALGDVLADYVDGGGGLVLSTYAFSTPWSIVGRITTPGYSPLIDAGLNGDISSSLSALVPGDPVFAGVTLGAVSFFHNPNFAHPGLAAGATLLATDDVGTNVIARSNSSRIIGLNLFPGTSGQGDGANNQEFYKLLANALVSVR